MENISNETTDMVVLQVLKLFLSQYIGQEAENFHVGELDVALRSLLRCVVQSHDDVRNTNISRLLRLVLEFDH